jgi:hypothetical protein
VLGYIKQVNEEQFKQQVEHIRQRFNRYGELNKQNIINFTQTHLRRLTSYLGQPLDTIYLLEEDLKLKTYDEALVFALRTVLSKRIAWLDKIKQVENIDELPF